MTRTCWKYALTVAYRLALIYWFVFRPTTRGAYTAVWHANELLLIRNSYKPGWTLPAGGVKSGETARQAAVRETREETGVDISESDLRHVADFTSRSEFKDDRSTVFEVTLDVRPPVSIDGREVEAAQFMPLSEIPMSQLNSIAAQYVGMKQASVGD